MQNNHSAPLQAKGLLSMKKSCLLLSAVVLSLSPWCHAFDTLGNNGIDFSMTQQDVESMGFVCKPSLKHPPTATCKNKKMSGSAFSISTKNYMVRIGFDKRVWQIRADLVGIKSSADYFGLISHLSERIPSKDNASSYYREEQIRDAWRTKSNAGVAVLYSKSTLGPSHDYYWIDFLSPTAMSEIDKKTRK